MTLCSSDTTCSNTILPIDQNQSTHIEQKQSLTTEHSIEPSPISKKFQTKSSTPTDYVITALEPRSSESTNNLNLDRPSLLITWG